MNQKIQDLTKTIYNEGIEKANAEAERIKKEAENKAADIVKEAENKAADITSQAEKDAADMKKTAASEIQLSGKQALSAVKQQITELLQTRVLDEKVKEAMLDPRAITGFIKTMLQTWSETTRDKAPSVEVLLPEQQKKELQKAFATSLKNELNKGVTIKFSREIKGGFQIGPADGSYKISLTDEDFNTFFKEYLRPKTRSLLFNE
ncbi:MAG TPA: V-type ATP synthase subunit E family protein [Spirochaetota bacterium]|nr:V-type ATP synthase subunit E family protein [Spirochaetota bacterium]